MFSALRRCPATLSRSLATATFTSGALRTSFAQSIAASRTSSSPLTRIPSAGFHYSAKWQQVVAAREETDTTDDEPATEFSQLATRGLVHPNIIDTITRQMKLTTMTDVQTRTINEALSGVDVIAQAKTGTGKTLGFLIPVVQRIIRKDPKLGEKTRGYKRARPNDIRAIVISPTRELAEQIAVEAKKVTANTGIVVQTAVGGTQKRMMLQKTQREGCHLLIGTPGRLNDILSDEYSGVEAPQLNVLVMDEADRLLDDGFQIEIDEIKKSLPNPDEVERQNLMFSATVPNTVVDLVRRTLRPNFHFAKCVEENEEPTHKRVPQKMVQLAGFENVMPALYEFVLKQFQANKAGQGRPFKAIIYFNSTAEVTLASSVFNKLSSGFKRTGPLYGMRGFEIHSKLTQSQRTRSADDFRFCQSGILFSSDVTARGMDFPNVSHVVQIGLPRDRETYIHRIGRTGRAGKEGEGWLFLTPLEEQEWRRRLRNLPLKADTSLETAFLDLSAPAEVPEDINQILTEVVDAHKKVYPDLLDAAFRGLFGSYQWYADKQHLLESANRLAEFGWSMENPPPPPASFYAGGGRRRDNNMRSGGRPGGFGERIGGWNDRSGGGSRDRSSSGGYNDRSGGYNRPRGGAGGSRGGFGGFGGDARGGANQFGSRQGGGRYSRDSGNDRRGGGRDTDFRRSMR